MSFGVPGISLGDFVRRWMIDIEIVNRQFKPWKHEKYFQLWSAVFQSYDQHLIKWSKPLKSCKYEHLFTKNKHDFLIKYEQFSLLKTGMISNLFMNLVNFLLQRIRGSNLWKAFGHSSHHRHINNHNTMKNIMTPNSKDFDRNQIKLY